MTIEIANRLCAYRKHFGYSQEQLAEKIGVSRQAVSKWERAEASPDTDNLITLSKIYGVTLDDLIGKNPEDLPKTEASFAEGIHINANNGDKVDIKLSGINVDTKEGEHIHVGFDGIRVEEKGHNSASGEDTIDGNQSDFLSRWNRFPWAMICLFIYIGTSYFHVFGGWSLNWIIFLTIPLYHTLGEAIDKKDPSRFAYPVLVTISYLYAGLVYSKWHPAWIVFLSIPIYYAFSSFYKNRDDVN